MPTFTFEGFTVGAPVALSVTQGPDTASASVATWGQQGTGTATIAIDQTETAITQYDSVRLVASGHAGWDTPADHAASGNIYKPQYHDIVYFWDTGKTGDFAAPQNLIAAHGSRQFAHGPVINVCYDTPGTKTVTLYAYEPSSGKWGTASATVTVNPADSAYPATQTICINPNGDTNFTAAPSGAQTITLGAGNVFDETLAIWTSNRGGLKKRFLFKGGAGFQVNVSDTSANITGGLMIGSYGTGRATFTSDGTNFFSFSGWSETTPKRVLLNNVICQGDFNPSTQTGLTAEVISIGGGGHLVVHRVDVNNVGGTVFNLIGNNTLDCYHHFDDFAMTGMGGQYPILVDAFTHPNSTFAMTGCRVTRDPQTDYDEGFSGLGGTMRAPVRINHNSYCYLEACDLFSNTGDQPALKIGEFAGAAGGVFNVHCCTLESANAACMRFKHNGANGIMTNLIWRQNVMVSGHNTTTFAMLVQGQGCSIDSNLHIAPGTAGQNAVETRGMIDFDATGGSSPGACPNYARNNTAVLYKTSTENLTSNFDVGINRSGLMSLTQGSNIEHEIGLGNIPNAPLEDGPVGVALFTLRNTGRYRTGSFDTGWASAPSVAYSFRPETGSTALGGADVVFYPFPIDAQTQSGLRPSGSEDRGCWQGAA